MSTKDILPPLIYICSDQPYNYSLSWDKLFDDPLQAIEGKTQEGIILIWLERQTIFLSFIPNLG